MQRRDFLKLAAAAFGAATVPAAARALAQGEDQPVVTGGYELISTEYQSSETTAPADADWHLVTYVQDHDKAHWYLDDVLQADGVRLALPGLPKVLSMSRRVNFKQQRLSDCRVYDCALSPEQLHDMAHNQHEYFITEFSIPYATNQDVLLLGPQD